MRKDKPADQPCSWRQTRQLFRMMCCHICDQLFFWQMILLQEFQPSLIFLYISRHLDKCAEQAAGKPLMPIWIRDTSVGQFPLKGVVGFPPVMQKARYADECLQ